MGTSVDIEDMIAAMMYETGGDTAGWRKVQGYQAFIAEVEGFCAGTAI